MRALIFLALMTPTTAWAFFCSRAGEGTGASLSWASRQVSYRFFEGGTADIAGEGEFDAVRQGFSVWEDLLASSLDPCVPSDSATDFDWVEDSVRSTTDRIGYDYLDPENNENLIIFRDDEWPYPGQRDTVIALSTVTFNSVTGEILDADIEYNSANFKFTNTATTNDFDLLNTSVHEIGHSLGIAHNSELPDASMFISAPNGEIKKRDLSSDDCAAMVFKYPAGEPNGYCTTVDASCGFCAPPEAVPQNVTATQTASGDEIGGCASASPATVFVVVLVFAAWVRRRVRPC